MTSSEKAAAHCLGLSHSTVKHHLANARFKVGGKTTAQPVCADPGDAPARPRRRVSGGRIGDSVAHRGEDLAKHLMTHRDRL